MRFQSITRFSMSRGSALTALLVTILGFGLAGPAAAGSGPYLVKDINTSGSSNPFELIDLNGTLMFSAKGGGKGFELWRSDGTVAGTRRVKDINPGGAGSVPGSMAAINGLLYFNASDGVSGHELWVSDGTNVGTHLVKDINPGSADSYPYGFTLLNGKVYFAARDAATGNELWRTDGTTAGTNRVKDISQGPDDSGPYQLTAFAGKLFFASSIGSVNAMDTLYASDGTAAGTKPFHDKFGNVITGGGSGAQGLSWLTVAGDRLFFIVNETELWRSNGTKATTKRIASMNAWEIVAVGNRAFFRSGEELWKSDGAAATTNLVKLFENSGTYSPVALNGQLFFFSNREPWTSNGTPAGTTAVGVQVQPDSNYANLGGVIFFGGFADEESASSAHIGPSFVPAPTLDLWRSDGTAGGTYSVAGGHGHIRNITAVGNRIFFASDADGHGTELWAYVP